MRLTLLIPACVLLALSISACGNSAPSLSLEGTVGYWTAGSDETVIASGATAPLLIRVEKRGDTYYLGIDGKPTEPAMLADGRIVLPWAAFGKQPSQFGMNDGEAALFAWVSHGMNPEPGEPTGFFYAPFPMKRLTPGAYERKADGKADTAVYWGLFTLDVALRQWARRPGGELPAAGELTPDSAFGRWLESKSAWPTNPFTAAPMRAGDEPGDFTYTPHGTDFRLVARLHDGTSISPTDGPPPP